MKLVTARKRHVCCGGCGVYIRPGDAVLSGMDYSDGPARWWMHEVCDLVADATEWWEWDPDDRWALADADVTMLPPELASRWLAHLHPAGEAS